MMRTMQDKKPLYIPPSKKWKGLTVYCYKCKTNMNEVCNENGKPLVKCPFGEKHAFKVYVHVPGTDNSRKTKKLETRDLNEAITQAIAFEKEVKGNTNAENKVNNAIENKESSIREIKRTDKNVPQLLAHAMARYIGFLNNEGVPAHMRKERSSDHLKDVARAFKSLGQCFTDNGYNLSTLRVNELNDDF